MMQNSYIESLRMLSQSNGATPAPKFPVTETDVNICNRQGLTKSQNVLDRVQIQRGPNEFSMLIRHLDGLHWCGYVLLATDAAKKRWGASGFDRFGTRSQAITFMGPSSRYITWMNRTQTGRLTAPAQTRPHQEVQDYWIGFDLPFGTSSNEALATLLDLHNAVESFNEAVKPQ